MTCLGTFPPLRCYSTSRRWLEQHKTVFSRSCTTPTQHRVRINSLVTAGRVHRNMVPTVAKWDARQLPMPLLISFAQFVDCVMIGAPGSSIFFSLIFLVTDALLALGPLAPHQQRKNHLLPPNQRTRSYRCAGLPDQGRGQEPLNCYAPSEYVSSFASFRSVYTG